MVEQRSDAGQSYHVAWQERMNVLTVAVVLFALTFITTTANADPLNHLLAAQEAAMALHRDTYYWTDYYRDSLNYESADIGTAHLQEVVYWLDDNAETEAYGQQAQNCTHFYTGMSWEIIQTGDEILNRMIAATNRLHQSVAEQLIASNVLAIDWDTFTALHDVRLAEAKERLDLLLIEIDEHINFLWHENIWINWELFQCLWDFQG